jgi:hypothetical protein
LQNVVDEALAFLVAGIRLAGLDHLQFASLCRDFLEAIEVIEQQVHS